MYTQEQIDAVKKHNEKRLDSEGALHWSGPGGYGVWNSVASRVPGDTYDEAWDSCQASGLGWVGYYRSLDELMAPKRNPLAGMRECPWYIILEK